MISSKQKYNFITYLFVILIVLLTSGCAQQERRHSHSMAMAGTDTKCKKHDALPALRCASAPSALFDAQGKLWIVWVYAGHVYISTSSDKGQSFVQSVAVNRVPEKIYARGENRPKIAIDNKGHIYISWTQRLGKRFSGHIRFSRSVDGGKTFSEPVIVNDHLQVTSHRFDTLAVNDKGHVYLAWLDKRDLLAAKRKGNQYNGAAVYYAVSMDGGVTFQKNKKIIDHSCQCCRVAIAIDVDQLPVIVWRHIYGDNIRDHALVKFKKTDQAGEVIRVSHDNWKIDACPHHGPAISISDNGVYHLAWFNNAPARHGLFYARSDDRGVSFSIPVNFGDYKKTASHPDVLSFGKYVYLIWKEFDGKQSSIQIMESSNAGESWSAQYRLAITNGASDHPFLLSDGNTVYASWHRQGQDYKLITVSKLHKDN